MFEELTAKLQGVFRKLKGRGRLSEKEVREHLRQVRRVLLEADVNYKVVKEFISSVEEKAVGEEVIESLTPGEMVVKIVYSQLTGLLGEKKAGLSFSRAPSLIMVVGLQGSGKTTTVAKLGIYLKGKGRRPLLVSCDVKRPAAPEQLRVLATRAGLDFFGGDGESCLSISRDAVREAIRANLDVVILDTAGRLHINDELMQELSIIKAELRPREVLLVADGMTGQDAVSIARAFEDRLGLSGVILTKLDGDARGGAALSMRAVTKRPIKFICIGEKLSDIEEFHPERMASRILGMGDVVSLIERAEAVLKEKDVERLEEKMRKESFTLSDFLSQLSQLKKMGPLHKMVGLLPGVSSSALKGLKLDERALGRTEAIIGSMTVEERENPRIIDGSRRRRIARGSGTTVEQVNLLLRQFELSKKMMKELMKGKRRPFSS